MVYDLLTIRNDKLYYLLMRSVRISKGELDSLALEEPRVLIRDAAHAMPIFAGEGGNHGLVDGLDLSDCIAKHGAADAGHSFYNGAYKRWKDGIDGSEKRLGGLHKPLEKWRELAKRGAD